MDPNKMCECKQRKRMFKTHTCILYMLFARNYYIYIYMLLDYTVINSYKYTCVIYIYVYIYILNEYILIDCKSQRLARGSPRHVFESQQHRELQGVQSFPGHIFSGPNVDSMGCCRFPVSNWGFVTLKNTQHEIIHGY